MIIIAVVVIFLIIIGCMGYVSAKSNECVVITGLGKERYLIGKTGFMVPFLEKRNRLELEQFNIDVKTSDYVPTEDFINVQADAAVKAKIGTSPEMLKAAGQNFLNWHTKQISDSIQDVLEGNLREIIGKMQLKKMVQDRQSFAEQVQANAAPDLAKMGLEIVAFTVQKFSDTGGVIENLGIDNIVTIQKEAANAKAKAEREMAEVRAQEDQAANDAKVRSELEISERQTELAKRKSELAAEAAVKKAQAEAAYQIESRSRSKNLTPRSASRLTPTITAVRRRPRQTRSRGNVRQTQNCTRPRRPPRRSRLRHRQRQRLRSLRRKVVVRRLLPMQRPSRRRARQRPRPLRPS